MRTRNQKTNNKCGKTPPLTKGVRAVACLLCRRRSCQHSSGTKRTKNPEGVGSLSKHTVLSRLPPSPSPEENSIPDSPNMESATKSNMVVVLLPRLSPTKLRSVNSGHLSQTKSHYSKNP